MKKVYLPQQKIDEIAEQWGYHRGATRLLITYPKEKILYIVWEPDYLWSIPVPNSNKEIARELVKSYRLEISKPNTAGDARPEPYFLLMRMITNALEERVEDCAQICDYEAQDRRKPGSLIARVVQCAKRIRELNKDD